MKRAHVLLFLVSFSFALCTACSDSYTGGSPDPDPIPDPTPDPAPGAYTLEAAFPALSFTQPLDLHHAGDDSDRIFVVERGGVIRVFPNDPDVSAATVFLDIRDRVDTQGEGGLLGMAFHPDYASNGLFYVNYTTTDNPLRTVISRFRVSGNPDQADPSSETEILTINQPFSNHNGGQIHFGPDGYLYISSGDGGGGGDPEENAQDRTNLLGTILRIDVDATQGSRAYAIPSDNPFVGNGQGYREEIYAYGLRNPYRFSFDSQTGILWAGDVGQNEYEEIDIIESGNNYGWDIVEGNDCFEPSQDCDRTGLTDPVFVYDHSNGDRSVTGGFVYRGSSLEGLTGWYIYGDFVSGRIWALDTENLEEPENIELLQAVFNISGFGTDQNNELYITGFDGTVYQLLENKE